MMFVVLLPCHKIAISAVHRFNPPLNHRSPMGKAKGRQFPHKKSLTWAPRSMDMLRSVCNNDMSVHWHHRSWLCIPTIPTCQPYPSQFHQVTQVSQFGFGGRRYLYIRSSVYQGFSQPLKQTALRTSKRHPPSMAFISLGMILARHGTGSCDPYQTQCFIIYHNCPSCFPVPGTNSTTQCGGGSFKMGNSLEDIGRCESWMAKGTRWWTERCSELCFFWGGWLQWLQWSKGRWPHPRLLDVVWCNASVFL